MAVSSTRQVESADFTRFQRTRGAVVGTFSQDLGATGDSSGGGVSVLASWTGREWGFKPILVLTSVSIETGSPPGNCRFLLQNAGNRRLRATQGFAFSLIAVLAIDHSPEYVVPKAAIEPVRQATGSAALFASVEFTTNTNGTAYHAHLLGLVVDQERMVKSGDYSALVALLS